MKFLKTLLKFGFVFGLVFIIYTIVYHYQVQSSPNLSFKKTFLASNDEISINAEKESFIPEDTGQELRESNINPKGFYIRIDRIGLFKPVVENVDPRYKEVYESSWESGVSHGKFTALPNQIGNVYLFAHAVNNVENMQEENAWFTLIDQLVENDEIIIYYKSKKYTYQVSKIYHVDPSATGVYSGVSPVPKVTLQTCGPPRGSLKSRYMVEALQLEVENFNK